MEVVKGKKSLKEQALAEVREEREEKAKESLKKLYRQLEDAKLVVRNIEREIDDCIAELES